jgi:urease accessory protein UreH
MALEVSIEGRPVLVDRVRLGSRMPALLGRGGLEGHRYLATLAVVAPRFNDWDRLVSEIAAHVGPDTPTPGGASRLASHGCVVRILADSAYALDDARRTLWALVRRRVLGLREMDLRKA